MNSLKKLFMISGILLGMVSCFDKSRPNYQYMPNMYMPVGYETYEKVDFLPKGSEAQLPVANTINRGWLPYEYDNSPEGKELARLQTSPLDSLDQEKNLSEGQALYEIYCAICHGNKGMGRVIWWSEKKFLGCRAMTMRQET